VAIVKGLSGNEIELNSSDAGAIFPENMVELK
jgi:hypothetical protein